ncbi:type II toxin-antitoxin system VapC family toxin [Caballeronia sp. AZ1_KS37]|uniref:type II toxin-antitoxin system VapC family toxin n=1 Tax=Caballeronia sp. AZ1_KS37 TaxID=2921756 RepID=UPI002028DB2D
MKLLLDTHLLIWAASDDPALPSKRAADRRSDQHAFTLVSRVTWEIVINRSLRRPDFQLDARMFRTNLLDAGYKELSIEAHHALKMLQLPPIHSDPSDRMLVAQAISEGIVLLRTMTSCGSTILPRCSTSNRFDQRKQDRQDHHPIRC